MPPRIDNTLRTYNAIHDLYDAETRDFWEKFPVTTVKKFVSGLHGKDVVNLGSGPGRDSIILRDNGLNVTCIDGSKEMVAMTSRLGFKSILCNLKSLQFGEGTFDGAWAYSSLIHLTFEESKALVEKICNFLKPGGLLFLGLIEGSGHELRSVGDSDYARYFEYYNREKVAELVKGIGFKLVYQDTFQPGNHVYLNYIFRKVSL